MNLRILKLKDANKMLTWMHDDFVVKFLEADFLKKNLADCENFIYLSWFDTQNLHMAIVNSEDEYMGTVSLKNINSEDSCAEFAITIARDAMGVGYSNFAIRKIIEIAFEELKLNQVYWYVSPLNIRALKFYEKMGYTRIDVIPKTYMCGMTLKEARSYYWYVAK